MYNIRDNSTFNQLKKNKNKEAALSKSCKKCKLGKC